MCVGPALLLSSSALTTTASAQAAPPPAGGTSRVDGGALPAAANRPAVIGSAPSGPLPPGTGKPAARQAPAAPSLPAHGVLVTPPGARGVPPAAAGGPGLRLRQQGIPPPPATAVARTPRQLLPNQVIGSGQVDNANPTCTTGFGANEPTVAQSSVDPSFVVVAAQEYQTGSGCDSAHAWAFTSHDAGQHWTPVLLPGLQNPSSGDVAIAFDPRHQVFALSFLDFTPATPPGVGSVAPSRLGVEVSSDGINWALDTTLAAQTPSIELDKDMITVDQNPASPHYGRIAVTWTQFVNFGLATNFADAYSDDGGATWHAAVSSIEISSGCGNGTSPAFDAAGELMVAWWSCDAAPSSQLKEALSTDGGATWPGVVPTVITGVDAVDAFNTQADACSLNAGGTAFRCNSFPSLAGDPNPNDEGGHAFVVVWDDVGQGCSLGDVQLCFALAQVRGLVTLDGGNTWTGPGGASFYHFDFADLGDKFFPWVAFAPDGRLAAGYSNRSVSAGLDVPHGSTYDEWITRADTMTALVANSYNTGPISETPSNPGSLQFIGDYSSTSSLDNIDTFVAFTDQRGTSNNHVTAVDLCFADCFRPLAPYTPVTSGSTSPFVDFYEFGTDPTFGGSGTDFWNAIGIREGTNGTTVDDDTALFTDRSFLTAGATSAFGPPRNDYTVENDNFGHAPSGAYFPRVNSFSPGPYTIEWASGFVVLPVGGGHADGMQGSEVVRVYDTFLAGGTTYFVGLRPNSGNSSQYSLTLHSASAGSEQGRPNARADSGGVSPGQAAFVSYSTGTDPGQYDGVVVVNDNGGSGSYTVYADDVAPGGSLNINFGAAVATQTNVTLNLSAFNTNTGDPVVDMRVGNGFGASGPWIPYVPNLAWTLPNLKGTRTVSVQYRNGAGAVSPTFSHSIVLQ